MANLKGFGLENFRLFKNKTDFELAPITILTGTNNSGKSSLSKALLLLSDTLNSKKLNYGNTSKLSPFDFLDFSRNDLHQLGGQKYISNKEKKEVVFTFDMDFTENVSSPNLGWKLEIGYCNDPALEYFYGGVQSFKIYKIENKEKIEIINLKASIDNLDNQSDLTIHHCYNFKYIFENICHSEIDLNLPFYQNTDFFINATGVDVDNNTRFFILTKALSEEYITGCSLDFNDTVNYITDFFGSCFGGYDWEFHTMEYSQFSPKISKEIKNLRYNINESFMNSNTYLCDLDTDDSIENFRENIFENILLKNIENCISKFQQIIYIPKEKISINRIHSRYSNESYIYKQKDELLQNTSSGKFYNKEDFKKSCNKWCEEFGIKNFIFEDIEGNGFKLSIDTGSGAKNMADVGYGIGQVSTLIYILFSIIETIYKNSSDKRKKIDKKIILLEEPEAGLHPNLQSKLAELFVDLQKDYDFQFIIETHSEYLIRKLQLLTAQKKIKTEDSIIHYFFHPDSEHTKSTQEQLRTIRIKENGHLDKEFGAGFLDEADNMALSIYQINMN